MLLLEKAQHRLYFLRRLISSGLTTQIMATCYRAVIESVLTFAVPIWLGSIKVKEQPRLNRVVKTASQYLIIVSAANVMRSQSHLSRSSPSYP